MDEHEQALEAIRRKLVGKHLTYQEIYAVMDEIAHKKLGDILTTYFAASGYSKGFSDTELYYLTKAMVETGEKLTFSGIVADKHSIGGVPGTRTSLIVTPIIAAAGFIMPKSSSRAITTPDGTADDMEVLASVTFTKDQIYHIVKKTNACIVWGGSVNIAPADDILIQVEKPLMFESYDKFIVSILAKKIAFGSNHVVIDIPYGDAVKVHSKKDAEIIGEKFVLVAKKFDIKLLSLIHKIEEPIGRGIGPVLETKDALLVLEQAVNRPLDLEKRSIQLAGALLELCLKDVQKETQEHVKRIYGTGENWAKDLLTSGAARKKMMEIIAEQGGKTEVKSTDLHPSNFSLPLLAEKTGTVEKINSKNVTVIAKLLGAPLHKSCGIFLEKKIGDSVHRGDILATLHGQGLYNLKEVKDTLTLFPIYIY